MRYVYGPAPSRRLGRSLGIDLVPYKTCTYDCIYCQLGSTTYKTTTRSKYTPIDTILDELRIRLRKISRPDYITLAGAGEPTLYAGIGFLIGKIKKMTQLPVAVITNGSLLWMSSVRQSIAKADLVLPSLDAGDARLFEEVNRPHPDISFEDMTEGLVAFSKTYRGKIWLEVLVLGGLTDSLSEMKKIASITDRIKPERVQLNTVSRPPAMKGKALPVSVEALKRLKAEFSGTVDVIVDQRVVTPAERAASHIELEALSLLLARRPCTVQDISIGLALPPNEVIKQLDLLLENSVVRFERRDNGTYYVLR